MNNHFFALLHHCMTLCITIHGCYGQQFVPLYDLHSLQRTDKLDGTTDSPITEGARISWSRNSHEYRIHAIDYDNIETFHQNAIRIIFMVGDLVKIIVLDTENVWTCQFLSARWARRFYTANSQGERINGLPYFNINIVEEEAPREYQTFHDVALYMRPYGLPQNDNKMFVLKEPPHVRHYGQLTVSAFLSGRFSVEKLGNSLRFTFEDAEDRSCTMEIYDDGQTNVDTVYNVISGYARAMYAEETGWVTNLRYDAFDSFL